MTIANRRYERLADFEIASKSRPGKFARANKSHSVRGELRGAPLILKLRDRFKMRRVHAQSHATEMVELKSLRNRADSVLVSNTVGRSVSPVDVDATVSSRLAVPTSRASSYPDMAWAFVTHVSNLELRHRISTKRWAHMLRGVLRKFATTASAQIGLHRLEHMMNLGSDNRCRGCYR